MSYFSEDDYKDLKITKTKQNMRYKMLKKEKLDPSEFLIKNKKNSQIYLFFYLFFRKSKSVKNTETPFFSNKCLKGGGREKKKKKK